MTQTLTDLNFKGKITVDQTSKYQDGMLFVGVLGVEYSVPYKNYLNQPNAMIPLYNLPSKGNPAPSALYYSYAKRTANPEEFAYSDGVLPVYIRFQPDLVAPLNDAANRIESGPDYVAQAVTIEQPTVLLEGKIALHNPDGSVSFVNKTIEYSVPVNPSSARVLKLSSESGLVFFLAHVR